MNESETSTEEHDQTEVIKVFYPLGRPEKFVGYPTIFYHVDVSVCLLDDTLCPALCSDDPEFGIDYKQAEVDLEQIEKEVGYEPLYIMQELQGNDVISNTVFDGLTKPQLRSLAGAIQRRRFERFPLLNINNNKNQNKNPIHGRTSFKPGDTKTNSNPSGPSISQYKWLDEHGLPLNTNFDEIYAFMDREIEKRRLESIEKNGANSKISQISMKEIVRAYKLAKGIGKVTKKFENFWAYDPTEENFIRSRNKRGVEIFDSLSDIAEIRLEDALVFTSQELKFERQNYISVLQVSIIIAMLLTLTVISTIVLLKNLAKNKK